MSTGSSEDLRRRLAAELQKGECALAGYHSSTDTDKYYNRDAAFSGESDETVSDLDATASSARANQNRKGVHSVSANRYGSARPSFAAASHFGRAIASSAAAAPVVTCRVCGKEFGSEKAVCGHMKVHALEAPHSGSKDKKVKKKRNLEVAEGWGATSRLGCSGLRTSMDIVKDSMNADPDHSVMDTVPAEPEPAYQPTPMAFAMPENSSSVAVAYARTSLFGESSSKKPMLNDDMDIAEAGANAIPPTEAVVHHEAAPLPAGRPKEYTCREPECRKVFSTHQALGGHAAAHKTRRIAAAGMHQDGGSNPKKHQCKECPAEFAKGVQLGGHMRKHWKGDHPVVPKKKMRLSLNQPLPQPADAATGPAVHSPADVRDVDDLTRSLPVKAESPSPAPAVDAAAAEGTPEPAPVPRVTGRVLLFGINIGLGVQKPPAQEGTPATKDSLASTGGEQQ